MYFLPLTLVSLISAALGSPTGGSNGLGEVDVRDILTGRASPENPSGNYAPAFVDCPTQRPTIRGAGSLSQSEQDWLKNRRSKTVDPLVQFLRRSNLTDFDAAGYVTSNSQNFSVVPNIGIAVSGGGYRALMNGAGFVAAADSRVPGSTDTGGIGGLLQSSTYLAGLSGGGWLVGSIFANNFSTVVQLRDGSEGSSLWQFSNSIFQGPKSRGISIVNTVEYWNDILDQVDEKRDAGYDISITDYWGRALSVQLINATDGGPAYTFSSIADAPNFSSADTPMPILVADERRPNTEIISLNSTVFEFNPWEFGSYDPTVYGFAPIRYVGSNFSGGSIPDNGHCLEGFDSYSYVMGTSSSLFNAFLLQNLSSEGIPSVVASAIEDLLTHIGDDNDDIAAWNPNPFLGYNNDTNDSADDEQLTLVDGGLDLQNIPLHPLIQPARGLDVIFAVDSSADTGTYFPNGTALRATYDRSKTDIANGTAFPAVPDAETFINLELNKRPTFFGCNTSEFSNASHIPPLIVYVPNAPYTAASNVSTFDPSYSDEQRNSIIKNGFNVATMGNGTVDSEWTACVACAVLSRSLERTGTQVSATCQRCFSRYCWNGTTDSRPVSSYDPTPILQFDTQSLGISARGGAAKSLVYGVVGIVGLVLAF
ncbi:lysophospholipase catalytic domain-containing protein [Annulohypoxylon bovei var. microspora]|nr:lysophospholipase catalytic domain-containing protein [Annulohypoxylon bovei var. microspora]